jgi:hypothetical protein
VLAAALLSVRSKECVGKRIAMQPMRVVVERAFLMFTAVAQLRSGDVSPARPATAGAVLRMIRRLAMVLATTLLAGATSTASADISHY